MTTSHGQNPSRLMRARRSIWTRRLLLFRSLRPSRSQYRRLNQQRYRRHDPWPVTSPTTIRPAPTQTPTPWPRTILGCFNFESYGWTGTGESFNLTEIWWFQPAGVGLINGTWIYPPPRKPQVSPHGIYLVTRSSHGFNYRYNSGWERNTGRSVL